MKFRADNPGYHENYMKNYMADPESKAKWLFARAKLRAKASNLEFSLSLNKITELMKIGICQKTGWKLDFVTPKGKRHRNPLGPSIDKIDPFGGYTDDNVQLVCNAYNTGKNQSTDAEFLHLCYAVVIHSSQKK